jgi:hypothetical protein
MDSQFNCAAKQRVRALTRTGVCITRKPPRFAATAALFSIALATVPAKAAPVEETFDFTLTGVAADGLAAGFSGSGTITATKSTNGAWIVDGATGSLSGTFNGVTLAGNITR